MPFDGPPGFPDRELEALITARELIAQPELWLQQAYQEGDRYCLVGALSVACASRSWARPNKLERELAEILAQHLPPWRGIDVLQRMIFRSARTRLIWFNDRSRTDHADVLDVINKAIRQLEIAAVRCSEPA